MMRIARYLSICSTLLLAGTIGSAAQPRDYDQTAFTEGAANAKPGPRRTTSHVIPVPTTEVSSQVQALISAPYTPFFDAHPKDAAAWKELVDNVAAGSLAALPALEKTSAYQ